jgi:hypothetical protein
MENPWFVALGLGWFLGSLAGLLMATSKPPLKAALVDDLSNIQVFGRHLVGASLVIMALWLAVGAIIWHLNRLALQQLGSPEHEQH